jgi:dihydroneopterin aldolase
MNVIETHVFIKQLALNCRIGVPIQEREKRQVIHVDIICELADPVVATDEMAASVDYSPIRKAALAIAEAQTFLLLETLAETIAQAALELQPRIKRITVTCEKPNKFSHCLAVGVRRTFER